MFDFIIVGAGFSGSVVAERIASVLNRKVLIVEKRNHVGGNCYDYFNENGILIHKYGPHIFHTNLKHVWDYISQFTEWYYYQHKVLGLIDGKKVCIPFNLNSLYDLFPLKLANLLEEKLVLNFGYGKKVSILKLRNVEDKDLKMLSDYVYEKVFLNYTQKQWGVRPEELDPSVMERVPIYISRDNRYFQDIYQGIPKEGYYKVFERMLSNPNIKILLNTNFKEVIEIDYEERKIYFLGKEFKGKLIFTGPIDEFFNYKYGKLPYRSLKFEYKTMEKEYYQEVAVVNYPNEYEFTRITEYKHMTGQKSYNTTISIEYPQEYDEKDPEKNIPFYPMPKKENMERYKKYEEKAKEFSNVIFLGRLGEYRYYNMDEVINKGLTIIYNNILIKEVK